jgi:predicted lipoprotein with Yx(FWY)xxD motif
MVEHLSRREEQRGFRKAYLWFIPLGFLVGFVIIFGLPLRPTRDVGIEEVATKGLVDADGTGAVGPATVKVKVSPTFGEYLADGTGHPLYLFKSDKPGTQQASTCYGNCAKSWPPLISAGDPVAKSPVKSNLLATTDRKNGAKQVTYNGWPLYRYAGDVGPEQITGQDVSDFGGEWYLMAPAGEDVPAAEAKTPDSDRG